MSTLTQPKARSGRWPDRVFAGAMRGAGIAILAILAAVAVFLCIRSWPAITAAPGQLARAVGWLPEGASLASVLPPLLFGTVLAAVIALVLAVPIAIGIALFIAHYAPRRLSQGLGYLVDLLAAVPSVVFGLWGGQWLLPRLEPVFSWLSTHVGFLPFFAPPAASPPRVVLSAGLVLAVMILPIVTAICREVFLAAPKLDIEGALALGATKWETMRLAVLPFGRPGIVSAAMLGLGRALGETMAVLMILSPGLTFSLDLIQAGKHQTIAANIAAQFPEASGLGVSALIATGLGLFVLTFLVNLAARWIVARRAEYQGAAA